jgi:hypothetical protein
MESVQKAKQVIAAVVAWVEFIRGILGPAPVGHM